ncbi:MAG: T9SS type A sorting domain-containing protein [Bacteroidota bacterium]
MKKRFTILLLALLSFGLSPVLATGNGSGGDGMLISADGQGQTGTLEAPYPNPVTERAFVKYELPVGYFYGELRVYSLIGQQVKTIQIDQAFGEAEIPTQELKSGIYFVYLVVDGKKLNSRKMIVTH